MIIADIAASTQPAVSIGSQILNAILSPTALGLLISAILGGVALLVKSELRRRQVASAIHFMHQAADAQGAIDGKDNSIVDKTAMVLKMVDEWMDANGWNKLNVNEKKVAELSVKSIEGALLQKKAPVP